VWSVDHIDALRQGFFQQASQQSGGNRFEFQRGCIAAIPHRHLLEAPFDHLHDEAAEQFGEMHVRLYFAQHLSIERIDIHRVTNGAIFEIIDHLLGDIDGDALLRLLGRSPQMRGTEDSGMFHERQINGRFALEHVEGCSRHLT
jgi:hypothetical protein